MSYIEEKTRRIFERGARDRAARARTGGRLSGLKVIPVPARIIAALVYIGVLAGILIAFRLNPADWSKWTLLQKVPFATFIPLLLTLWVLLIGYVNGDAKRRGMRYVMWTLLAIFVPNAIGVILYFLLRDPLPAPCPGCSAMVGGTYSFCPHCGAVLAPACPHCRRPVERTWTNCTYCGTRLPGSEKDAA